MRTLYTHMRRRCAKRRIFGYDFETVGRVWNSVHTQLGTIPCLLYYVALNTAGLPAGYVIIVIILWTEGGIRLQNVMYTTNSVVGSKQ